jgi:hypothetical protein
MPRLLLTTLAVLSLAVGSAPAGDPKHGGPECTGPACEVPAQKVQVTYVEQTITAYRTVEKVRKIKLKMDLPVTRDVPMETTCVMMPVWSDEKQVTAFPMPVVRQDVYLVPVCRWESECVTDPHTGCTYTMAHQVTELKPVKSTHVERVPCHTESLKPRVMLTPTEAAYQPAGVILECKQQEVEVEQRYLVTEPYKKTIKVPVYTPVPECPAPGCPVAEPLPAPKPDKEEKRKEGT